MGDIQDAITQAATEAGIDPAFALAVAQRESNFDPNAHSSKTIFGLYQMRGDLRRQYGIGDSSDPYTQAKGWTAFIGDQKAQMEKTLGRPVTNEELYFAHHFGTDRAIQMIGGDPNTNVGDVFSPYERQINPHFDRAGTTGNLMSSIAGDISRRTAAFGGQGGGQWGAQTADASNSQTVPNGLMPYRSTSVPGGSYPTDPAGFGRPMLASDGGSSAPPESLTSPTSPTEGSQETLASASPAPSAEPVYGMSAPEARALSSNPGYMAQRAAQMRGGRPGQEVDISQFGVKAGDNLKNPALSNAAPANPAVAAATATS
jgi:hypothetical protein